MYRSILTVICFLVMAQLAYGQLPDHSAVSKKKARVILSNGKILKGRVLRMTDSELEFKPGSGTPRTFALRDVQRVQMATKNRALLGALIGATVGVTIVAEIVANEDVTIHSTTTITYTYGEYGRTATTSGPYTEVEGGMSTGAKIGIITGSTIAGGLIGSMIKTGWKNVYPQKKMHSRKTGGSIGFAILPVDQHGAMLHAQIRF